MKRPCGKMNPSFCFLCVYYCRRYGALSGHRRAHTRVWSQILTARQDLESSAPSPIHRSSRSTLAARQMLPWTLNTSVIFGDASLLSAVYQQSEMDVWGNGSRCWQSLSGQGTREPLKLSLPCHLMLIRTKWAALFGGLLSWVLLHKDCKQLSPTYELKCSYKCAFFEHWKPDKWLQNTGEPLSHFVSCLFVTKWWISNATFLLLFIVLGSAPVYLNCILFMVTNDKCQLTWDLRDF